MGAGAVEALVVGRFDRVKPVDEEKGWNAPHKHDSETRAGRHFGVLLVLVGWGNIEYEVELAMGVYQSR